MHRIVNYGSVLQAYALQHFLDINHIDNEIIDYYATKPAHKVTLKGLIRGWLLGGNRKIRQINNFCETNYRLSPCHYDCKEELDDVACRYDIFLTGSDQVWNPSLNGEECVYMFDFVRNRNVKKISFASSFTQTNISEELRERYKKYLSEYAHISVRELSGLSIVEKIIGGKASLVCDPTWLLSREEWNNYASKSFIKVKKPFILCYILAYSYYPYPDIYKIIKKVQKELNMDVIFVDGKLSHYFLGRSKVMCSVSPYDFIALIRDCSFLITTSFHGTIFSIMYRKPFYSVIQQDQRNDNRMLSFLESIGLSDRAIKYNEDFDFNMMNYSRFTEQRIKELVEYSKEWLLSAIKD